MTADALGIACVICLADAGEKCTDFDEKRSNPHSRRQWDADAAELVALRADVARLTAENARLSARVADLSNGIHLRGWWCLPCDSFNGEEHSKRDDCRSCGRPKHARPAERA